MFIAAPSTPSTSSLGLKGQGFSRKRFMSSLKLIKIVIRAPLSRTQAGQKLAREVRRGHAHEPARLIFSHWNNNQISMKISSYVTHFSRETIDGFGDWFLAALLRPPRMGDFIPTRSNAAVLGNKEHGVNVWLKTDRWTKEMNGKNMECTNDCMSSRANGTVKTDKLNNDNHVSKKRNSIVCAPVNSLTHALFNYTKLSSPSFV